MKKWIKLTYDIHGQDNDTYDYDDVQHSQFQNFILLYCNGPQLSRIFIFYHTILKKWNKMLFSFRLIWALLFVIVEYEEAIETMSWAGNDGRK